MTPEQAKYLLPIMQAYADGKDIEVYNPKSRSWEYVINPTFSPNFTYRIKPDPIVVKYRRFIHKHPSKDVFSVVCVNTKAEVFDVELWSTFVRWIDSDWITEEVEINHD